MTEADIDDLLKHSTWNGFVETLLSHIVAELPRRSTGSANALLSGILKSMYEKGAAAAHHYHHETDEGEDATLH